MTDWNEYDAQNRCSNVFCFIVEKHDCLRSTTQRRHITANLPFRVPLNSRVTHPNASWVPGSSEVPVRNRDRRFDFRSDSRVSRRCASSGEPLKLAPRVRNRSIPVSRSAGPETRVFVDTRCTARTTEKTCSWNFHVGQSIPSDE